MTIVGGSSVNKRDSVGLKLLAVETIVDYL
jgi:hypothetical protein